MSPPDHNLCIVIVEDHPVVIEGLRKILLQDLPIRQVLDFQTGADCITHLKKVADVVDVVLLDISLPDTNGIELCRQIKKLSPETCVLGFSNHNDRTLVLQMLANGASGYMLKNVSATELVHCIREALEGKVAFSEEISKIMSKPSAGQLKAIPPLTKREKQILRMIADGKTSVEISEELSVSPFTIETHRRNLMQKFDVNNAALLIKIASDLRLI